jgi:hypothetical protein
MFINDRRVNLSCLGLESAPGGAWVCDGCGGCDQNVSTCAQESVLHPPLTMGGEVMPWTHHGTYLGVVQSDDCSLDREITHRITLARAAFRKLRPLIAGGKASRHMRSSFARAFEALTVSVLLHGSESWALSSAQLDRLEVFQRSCLRSALPRRKRGPERAADLPSNAFLEAMFRLPSVATLLERRQLRWCGHLARMDETRIPAKLCSMGRSTAGTGTRGRGRQSLLGVFGCEGVYSALIKRHLTPAARASFFGGIRGPWYVLAANRSAWRRFVSSVSV